MKLENELENWSSMTKFNELECFKCNGLFGVLYDGEEVIHCPYCGCLLEDGFGLGELILKWKKKQK